MCAAFYLYIHIYIYLYASVIQHDTLLLLSLAVWCRIFCVLCRYFAAVKMWLLLLQWQMHNVDIFRNYNNLMKQWLRQQTNKTHIWPNYDRLKTGLQFWFMFIFSYSFINTLVFFFPVNVYIRQNSISLFLLNKNESEFCQAYFNWLY